MSCYWDNIFGGWVFPGRFGVPRWFLPARGDEDVISPMGVEVAT